jgi:hypothetical protein
MDTCGNGLPAWLSQDPRENNLLNFRNFVGWATPTRLLLVGSAHPTHSVDRKRSLVKLFLRGSLVQSGIGGGNDRRDGLLVEAFVALAPFQVFEVAANRPFTQEFLVL